MFILAVQICGQKFGNDDFITSGIAYKKENKYYFEKLIISNIIVKDNAAIYVDNAESNIAVKLSIFEKISSNFGSCGIWISSNTVNIQNICFSSLFPHYTGMYGVGGTCVSSNSISDVNITFASINNINNNKNAIFATLGFYSSNEHTKNVNQTNCHCQMDAVFVCGIFSQDSIDENRLIIFSSCKGDIICRQYRTKGSCLIENTIFENCTANNGLNNYEDSKFILTMRSCVVKNCTGNIYRVDKASIILESWYSDIDLPDEFKNTKLEEFNVPIEQVICNAHLYDGSMQWLGMKSHSVGFVIFLSFINKLFSFEYCSIAHEKGNKNGCCSY